MTPTDFSLLDDPPSDAPTRSASKNQRTPELTQQKTENHEERQFISRLIQRDPESWNEFVTRYQRLIVSRILATCAECSHPPSSDLIEECTAEVMSALFQGDLQALRQFKGRSKLSTWLAIIVRRTTLSVLRKQQQQKKQVRPNDSQFDIATVPDSGPNSTSESETDKRAELNACMARLKASDRCVLEMYFHQKKSYAEIGRVLGITENAVGPKIHRARKRLKQLLKANREQT